MRCVIMNNVFSLSLSFSASFFSARPSVYSIYLYSAGCARGCVYMRKHAAYIHTYTYIYAHCEREGCCFRLVLT